MRSYRVLGKKEVEKLLQKYSRAKVIRAVKKAFNLAVVLLVSRIRQEDLSGPTSSKSVSARSGKLRQNVKVKRAVVTATGVEAGVTAGTAYARVHIGRRGRKTVIRPKNVRWLTIPLEAAKTKAGVARGSARSGVFGETFVMKTKANNLLIMGKRVRQSGKSAGKTFGNLVPLFVLKKKVVIKARVDPRQKVRQVQRQIPIDVITELQRG